MSRLTNQVQKELNEALANEDYRKAAAPWSAPMRSSAATNRVPAGVA